MSGIDSQPGRERGFSIRNLLRSSPSPSPSSRRVSRLLRRARSVWTKYFPCSNPPLSFSHTSISIPRHNPQCGSPTKTSSHRSPIRPPRQSSDSSDSCMDSAQHLDPAAMLGLADAPQGTSGQRFNLFEWHPHYQNCQQYFLDHAQHSGPVQALCAFLNIRLPFQRHPHPVHSAFSPESGPSIHAHAASTGSTTSDRPPAVSLIPYIRRLVATGMDSPGVLHGFFGDDWDAGVGPLHEQERRNYLFAAKSGGWAAVKKDYDMPPLETIPFLRPLQGPVDSEIEAAERCWSEWLAMEDWMLGPRAPDVLRGSSSMSRPSSARG